MLRPLRKSIDKGRFVTRWFNNLLHIIGFKATRHATKKRKAIVKGNDELNHRGTGQGLYKAVATIRQYANQYIAAKYFTGSFTHVTQVVTSKINHHCFCRFMFQRHGGLCCFSVPGQQQAKLCVTIAFRICSQILPSK